MSATLRERLFSRLIIDQETGCLLWQGHLDRGYGRISVNGRSQPVHRVMYEMFVGPIPYGLHIDHLCRVPRCASPAHLEAVTAQENLLRGNTLQAANARKTHCPRGHPYDEANTKHYEGMRYCRECIRTAWQRKLAARPAKAAS